MIHDSILYPSKALQYFSSIYCILLQQPFPNQLVQLCRFFALNFSINIFAIFTKYEGWRPIEKQHTIAKTNLQTSIFSLSPLFSAHRSSVFFVLESFDLRSPMGGRTDLGQPITAVRPDGVSPGRVGLRVFKRARRIVLRIALPASLLRRRVLRIALDVGGTRWRVRVRTGVYYFDL
jgi:hypothetical protein